MFDSTKRKQISTSCPRCLGRIGLLAGMRSQSPFSVRCPHCKTKLAVRMPGQLRLILMVVALLVPAIWAIHPIHAAFGMFGTILYSVLLLLLGMVLDASMGVIYFTHARFIPVDKLKDDKREKELL